MPHIYQPIIHRRDQFGKGSLKQVGHSVKFVQFTYKVYFLILVHILKTLGMHVHVYAPDFHVYFVGNQLELCR